MLSGFSQLKANRTLIAGRAEMGDQITKETVKEAVSEVLVERVDPLIKKIILEMLTDKFEKTLGVNCMDPDDRLETRKDMEFARAERLHAMTKEGKAERAFLKTIGERPQAECDEIAKDAAFVRDLRLGARKTALKIAGAVGLGMLAILWPDIVKHIGK
ncbi:hypothetical protein LG047_15180 [Methylocystis sp. WRRC1]|uniref:hypothetical protein n=1 Tax=Methylocystis sp. WRRC1 TaxID=1732014 RepID=UPI001D142053|nr:hypothetical protein [Methylocystis sp. WRRC1]MCC3246643.1 hypothetical protein [Methylocystis sp. WRRC1]